MKKVLFYSLLAYVLTVNVACGDFLNNKLEHNIQPELAPYLKIFLDDAASRDRHINVSDLVMTIEDIPRANVLGMCKITRKKNAFGEETVQKRIVIDSVFFRVAKEEGWEPFLIALVYHEMGHCYLNRGHDNRYAEVKEKNSHRYHNAALSLMHGYTISFLSDYVVSEYWDYYRDEMFGQSKIPLNGTIVGNIREITVSKAHDHEHEKCDDFEVIEIAE